VADPRPTFHWQPVEGADGYHLEVILPGGQTWSLETNDTTLPYPADVPPLAPGSANIVNLLAFGPIPTADKTLLRVPTESQLAELTEAKEAIRLLAIDEAAQCYLLAHLFREQELWEDAISQLEQLVTAPDITSAYLFQQLGDLYFRIELYIQAEENYGRALNAAQASVDPYAQAMAHIGIARVAVVFGETQRVHDHLVAAESLYQEADDTVRAHRTDTKRFESNLLD
jgi:tetratricopeptide (TPR) repeat protein